MSKSILYIADSSAWSCVGAETVARTFQNTQVIFWNYGDPPPTKLLASWEGDWIISMKNDLLIPPGVLKNAREGAINFHPAPPRYRGLGGYVYAVYNGDETYGITCHHMTNIIDKGPIIRVLNFPLFSCDTTSSLRERTGAFCIALLHEIILHLEHGQALPIANERWGEKLFTRKDLSNFLEEIRSREVEHLCLR